jgi:hypothetical protein
MNIINKKMKPTPTAQLIKQVITMYNLDEVEYWSHSHMVNHGLTGAPYLKHYYKIDICSQVISFYDYYFPRTNIELLRYDDELESQCHY